MPILLPPSVHDPRDIPIEWYRQIAEALYSLSQGVSASGSGNLAVNLDRGGINILDLSREWFIAELTGESSGAYAWRRLVSTTGGTNSVDGYGTAGTTTALPAYEMNGATGIPSGTYVLMWPADSNQEMRFVRGLSSAALFTLAGRTGSSTISSGDTLTILRTTVAADTATPDDASATLPGDVSTGAQTFAGRKTFQDGANAPDFSVPAAGTIGFICDFDATGIGLDVGMSMQRIESGAGDNVVFSLQNTGPRAVLSTANHSNVDYAIYRGGSLYTGATGTGGGGDTVKGGIITTLGSGPPSSYLDMGTW